MKKWKSGVSCLLQQPSTKVRRQAKRQFRVTVQVFLPVVWCWLVEEELHQRNTILWMWPMCRVRQSHLPFLFVERAYRTDFSASQQNQRMNRHPPT